jgi:hypothetical protein
MGQDLGSGQVLQQRLPTKQTQEYQSANVLAGGGGGN